MNFNPIQISVINDIIKFINNPVGTNPLLILGPGGSGKSTVVGKALAMCNMHTPIQVMFCAFMNKAVSALRERTPEVLRAQATFTTIHRMLRLEPKYVDVSGKSYDMLTSLDAELRATLYDYDNLFSILTYSSNEEGLQFAYDFNKTTYLKNFNVIVIDECSTKSRELWVYTQSTLRWLRSNDHNIKVIYIGDQFQLPPVGESTSIVFDTAQAENWLIRKLETICRTSVPLLTDANNRFVQWLRTEFVGGSYVKPTFIETFPFNIIPHSRPISIYHMYDRSGWIDSIVSRFINGANPSVICVTYSNDNAFKLNQEIVLGIAGRYNYNRPVDTLGGEPPKYNDDIQVRKRAKATIPYIQFRAGDRILIKNPIELVDFEEHDGIVSVTGGRNEFIFNGDIYTVLAAQDVQIKTNINQIGVKLEEQSIPSNFHGQILTVTAADWNYAENYDATAPYEARRISGYHPTGPSNSFKLLNIDFNAVKATYTPLRARLGFLGYCEVKQQFRRFFSQIQFGYALTVYKVQGSEADSVYVNLTSFWLSLLKMKNDAYSGDNIQLLVRAFYVAITRARQYLSVYWSNRK